MQNNLFLRRLVIYTNEEKIAYDEHFHKGVNIICGDNSSGKSTITHFIFFALGGVFNDFVPEARQCHVVYAELESNGSVFTVKRYISINDKSKINSRIALNFFWGDYDESINPPINKYWEKFEYNSNDKKKNFSSILFELLNLPEVKGDDNIGMHQILRLLYIDQESPTSSLFYYEQFDSQITRETVADLLLGIYRQDLYDNKYRLDAAIRELADLKSEIKATKNFFPDAFSLNTEHIRTSIENKEIEMSTLNEEIINLREQNKVDENYSEKSKLEFQQLNEIAIAQRVTVNALQNNINSLKDEIADSEFFVETLQNKIRAIENSVKTRDFLGNLPLEYCPECLNKLELHNVDESCKLCKQKTDDKFGVTQAKRMQLELGFQIKESQLLLKERKNILQKKEAKYEAELTKVYQTQQQVNASVKDIRSFSQEKLDNLNISKGFIEGEILQYRTMLEQAQLYEKLIEAKNNLDKEIGFLNSEIYKIQKNQTITKKKVYSQIQTEGVYLLNNDLDRQKEFSNAEAEDFNIDFVNNLVYLKSENTEKFKQYQRFSASSNFYLKVAARFAIFLASLSQDEMRFPRFIFADNMEDKGIEEKRAQNLQDILIKRVNEFDSNSFQLIYTTSFITEELFNSSYVVGNYYTKDKPSLKNIS